LLLSGGSDGTARAWEVKNGYRHYATLLPLWGPMGVGVALSPEGDYRGPLGIDDHLAYIVRTDRGDATLSPTEFNAQHGWVNEPWQVGLYRPGAEPMERIYVKADAPGPFDGRTWATAFRDLQDALSAARPNTEIWVAQGVYTPDRGTGARIASFNLKNGVRLFGGFAGNETRVHERDPDRYETILSGDLNADDRPPFANNDENSYHVVTSRDLDPNTLLDGFAITGGNANGPKEGEYHHGGGVYSSWSGARYIRCVFRGNTARHWGGGFFGSNGNRCPELTDCRFIGNAATDVDEGAGGGLWASGGRYILRDCLFIGNTAGSWGGAICHELCAPHLVRCVLRGNAAPRGAGLANSHGTQAVIMNCVFAGNTSTVEGGGIYGYVGRAHLTNCLFVHNQGGGGAIYAHAQSHLVISNCTFSGNSHIGVYGDDTSTLVLANSILWANSSGEDWSESAQVSARLVTVNSCCVQGWTGRLGGADNVGLNPLFMDPNGPDGRIDTFDDDFRLRDDSLCRDIGDNSAVPADAFDLDRDGDPNEPIPFDVAGRPRIQNGRVDLGAHESDLPLSDR
jgi:hypothetical protein